MHADIKVFDFWTGKEVSIVVHNGDWTYKIVAKEPAFCDLITIIPGVENLLAQARSDWFDNNHDSHDPDLLDAHESSGSAIGSVVLTEEQFDRLTELKNCSVVE